jgi:DNA polymerase
MIGEAPGKTEELRGEAFIGRAGQLLEWGIEDALAFLDMERPSIYITNVVACRPTDRKRGPNRPPSGEEAWACWPRLEECFYRVNPSVLIFLGKVAENYCKKVWGHGVSLVHPAYILRQGGTKAPEYRRFCRELSEAFRPLTEED